MKKNKQAYLFRMSAHKTIYKVGHRCLIKQNLQMKVNRMSVSAHCWRPAGWTSLITYGSQLHDLGWQHDEFVPAWPSQCATNTSLHLWIYTESFVRKDSLLPSSLDWGSNEEGTCWWWNISMFCWVAWPPVGVKITELFWSRTAATRQHPSLDVGPFPAAALSSGGQRRLRAANKLSRCCGCWRTSARFILPPSRPRSRGPSAFVRALFPASISSVRFTASGCDSDEAASSSFTGRVFKSCLKHPTSP